MFEFYKIDHESEYLGEDQPVLRVFSDPMCNDCANYYLSTFGVQQGVVISAPLPDDEEGDVTALFSITVDVCTLG